MNWNTPSKTLACLDTLIETSRGSLNLQCVVIENGSIDDSAEMLRRRNDFELIVNDENRGFAAAVNQGYRRARAPLILLLNPDIQVHERAIEQLARFLQEHPSVTGVGPLYIFPDGAVQQHHFRLPTFANLLAIGFRPFRALPLVDRRMRHYRMADDDFSSPRRVPQPSASCLLLRRSAFESDTLLNESFPIFFNDVMLARDLYISGHELWMTPDAVVEHELGGSTRLMGPERHRHYVGALARYVSMTEPPPRILLFRLLVFTQMVARRVHSSGGLSIREAWRTVCGDMGPLPTGHGIVRPPIG